MTMAQIRNLSLCAFALSCSINATAAAAVIKVQIDSTVSGCSECSGGPVSVPIGRVITPLNPVQLTLDAGAYTITNAASSGYYSAWNFSGGWVWSFVIADDATGKVLETGYDGSAVYATQADAAGATGIATYREAAGSMPVLLAGTSVAGFTDTLTLAAPTKLDFFIVDYYGTDNNGGVALNLSPVRAGPAPVPEPWALALLGLPLVFLMGAGRKPSRV